MCVDFAWKSWEQAGSKWGLRNVKLRMSRKLIFVSGLLTVFGCGDDRFQSAQGDAGTDRERLRDHLVECARLTPIDVIAKELSKLDLAQDAGELFHKYNAFLEKIDEANVRNKLERLSPAKAYKDGDILALRKLSHELQDILTNVFFRRSKRLRNFTEAYGLF